ncbi:MAG TPA: hypothetical protein VJ999_08100 [Candidatus Sulfotelmatobacter sp.]|nr:hypothetical protein [Candidatus Sulfotelmatobacter sp.]
MRASLAATLVTVLLITGAAFAQEKAGKQESATAASAKPLTVSGRVSTDGKTLLTDIDSEWAVDNTEVLKGQEGRRVTVKCYVDTEKNRIQILSVKRADSEANYAASHSDSAFRR